MRNAVSEKKNDKMVLPRPEDKNTLFQQLNGPKSRQNDVRGMQKVIEELRERFDISYNTLQFYCVAYCSHRLRANVRKGGKGFCLLK